MAKPENRLGRDRPEEIFRVRVPGLKPEATYYYTVDSTQANGKSDGVKSPVKHFTAPRDPQPAPPLSAGGKRSQGGVSSQPKLSTVDAIARTYSLSPDIPGD